MKCCLRPNIRFCGGIFIYVSMKEIKRGNRFIDRTGEIYDSFQGYKMTIINYKSSSDITVQFNDERGTIREKVAFKEIKNGGVKNPYHKTTLGIGFVGSGNYKPKINNKMTPEYRTWDCMLRRCYSSINSRAKTYSDVEVCEEWYNFQNFAKWYEENYVDGWVMDKDIICPDCRLYSPETCRFIPEDINNIFKGNNRTLTGLPRGVYPKDGGYQCSMSKFGKNEYLGYYKTVEEAHETYIKHKTQYLKDVAEKWKGIISEEVYQAILNYDINRFL